MPALPKYSPATGKVSPPKPYAGRMVLERIEVYPPSLSPEQSAPPRAPVYLLHGADDTVIPAVETTLLARYLRQKRTPVNPLLSGLITHAEVDKTAAAAETWKLVGFWSSLLSR